MRQVHYMIQDTGLYYTGCIKNRLPSSGRYKGPHGTLKYQDKWYEFDHILVSGGFMTDSILYVKPAGTKIFAPDFLLEKDPYSPGLRPYRTFRGYNYHGGFSDHLPVYIDLWRAERTPLLLNRAESEFFSLFQHKGKCFIVVILYDSI